VTRARRPRIRAVVSESLATATTEPVGTALTVLVTAALCLAVLLTTGRTVGSERLVLSTIDAGGTRSMIVRAEPPAMLDSTVVDRLTRLESVDWVGAFGPAVDMRNARTPAATNVAVRTLYTPAPGELDIPMTNTSSQSAVLASERALELLGLPDAAGAVRTADGVDQPVTGRIAVPDFLTFLEPLAVNPRAPQAGSGEPVAVVVVVADHPSSVAALAEAVTASLAVNDTTQVSITTSEALATLRTVIKGQLGGFGRALVLAVFSVLTIVVAALMYGLVMIRRKDYGRRRALGATRALIIALIVVRTAATSLVGALVGSVAASIVLLVGRDPAPAIDFVVAVGLLAIASGVLGSLPPAIAASHRDPLTELRVP
jgi:putative ABC transport system permease protein